MIPHAVVNLLAANQQSVTRLFNNDLTALQRTRVVSNSFDINLGGFCLSGLNLQPAIYPLNFNTRTGLKIEGLSDLVDARALSSGIFRTVKHAVESGADATV